MATLPYDDQTLYQTLVELEVIDKKQLDQAFKTSQDEKIPLETVLFEKDLISDENLGRTIAEAVSLPFIQLSTLTIPDDVLRIIPEEVAKKQNVIAFRKDEKGVSIAFSDPTNTQIREFLKRKVHLPIRFYIATRRDIHNAFSLYQKNIMETFSQLIKETVKKADTSGKQVDPPIITIVTIILEYAYQNKASDVHIEPLHGESLVRFRIDGILHDIVTLPLVLHKSIVTRIKILSNLRTDEHQAAQDGKLQFLFEGEETDVRVSVVPIKNGEKIVMRLLSERSRQFSLIDLGFGKLDLVKVKDAYTKPFGMILTTGPTGSGKTTTVYAILKLLNKRDVNIMTIEDPIEYDIEGVNQIQVNTKTNLTFAEGLKSIVRQDPDIILVGEIRDDDTADIAINSALTGHLVLSTLHTNDAATAFPRLLDMHVEPFLVASTVNVVIAQRLVRKIHNTCRVSEEVEVASLQKHFDAALIKRQFGTTKKIRLYRGKGCQLDHNTGYEGRIGIFEVLLIDDEIRDAINKRADAETIRKIAMKNGMIPMIADGLEKVKEGQTTLEEILRVTKE